VTVRRSGDEIVAGYGRREVRCGHPTVHSVDTVRVLESEFHIDIRGGRFAPGATPEGDGSSEIEFEAAIGGGFFFVHFGDGADRVEAGRIGQGVGLNLNPEEAHPDADIVVAGDEDAVPEPRLFLGRGDDTVDLGSTAGFDGLLGHYSFPEVHAGPGADRIRGGPGFDRAYGGPGPDRITSRGAPDSVDVLGGGADVVDCGQADDYLVWGHEDSAHDCEHRSHTRG
jgi:hypothetical protein